MNLSVVIDVLIWLDIGMALYLVAIRRRFRRIVAPAVAIASIAGFLAFSYFGWSELFSFCLLLIIAAWLIIIAYKDHKERPS